MKKISLPVNYDSQKFYSATEAFEILPKLSTSKFVGSVDVDIVLNVSEKQKKESLRGSVTLPHVFGTPPKIIVFADEKDAQIAITEGAVAAGMDKLITQVEKGEVGFDIVLATPDVMPQIAKLGKILGPKGLMPNPANGTISKDLKTTIANFQGGKQGFKMSDQGVIRGKIGKLDMKGSEIEANFKTYLGAIATEARKFNSQPIKKIVVSPTMGSAVKIDVSSVVEKI